MSLMPVEEALERILAGVMPIGEDEIGLRFASGRTLTKPLSALLNNPAFDASAMDGYAVRSEDAGAGRTLKVIGKSTAGLPFRGEISSGQAVRIFTGAALPAGANAIVLQEDASLTGDDVRLNSDAPPGQHIRRRGTDFKAGDCIGLNAGRRLTPRDVLLLAASGHAAVPVYRQPVVAILATGDELVEPGIIPGEGEIVSSNSYGLAGLVEQSGAIAKLRGIAHDTIDSLLQHFAAADDADLLITTGGASVGDHDLVRPALEQSGAVLAFYKLALRPGKPMFYGTRIAKGKTQRIIGLPGNPVSAMVCAQLFALPLLGKMQGRDDQTKLQSAVLTESLPANGPRQHYMRAVRSGDGALPNIAPVPLQDSSLTRALAMADSLIVVPPNAPPQSAGSAVFFIALD